MTSDDSIKNPENAETASEAGQSNFDLYIGTEWIKLEPEDARARVELTDDLRQPYGIMQDRKSVV